MTNTSKWSKYGNAATFRLCFWVVNVLEFWLNFMLFSLFIDILFAWSSKLKFYLLEVQNRDIGFIFFIFLFSSKLHHYDCYSLFNRVWTLSESELWNMVSITKKNTSRFLNGVFLQLASVYSSLLYQVCHQCVWNDANTR